MPPTAGRGRSGVQPPGRGRCVGRPARRSLVPCVPCMRWVRLRMLPRARAACVRACVRACTLGCRSNAHMFVKRMHAATAETAELTADGAKLIRLFAHTDPSVISLVIHLGAFTAVGRRRAVGTLTHSHTDPSFVQLVSPTHPFTPR
jgi:hypothetical protein